MENQNEFNKLNCSYDSQYRKMDKVNSAVYASLVYCNTDHKGKYKKQSKETTDTGICRISAFHIMHCLCSDKCTSCNLSVFYSKGRFALSDTVDAVGNDVDS